MVVFQYHPLNETGKLYFEDFEPVVFGEEFFKRLGVCADETLVKEFESSSKNFAELYKQRALACSDKYVVSDVSDDSMEIHNYTGMCPTNVLEVSPSNAGACSISCLYCLVNDGKHVVPISVFLNYPAVVEKNLERVKDHNTFFYFSPKTEAFSEPFLETGVAHEILRKFVEHYDRFPDSKARLFIASKAGMKNLEYENNGDSILGLLRKLKGKVQFNSSIGIMPQSLHEVLEPNAACVEDRLEAFRAVQNAGAYAVSVLSQPIIPLDYDEDFFHNYFLKLKQAGVENIKPEFLTTNFTNLAVVSQFVNHFFPTQLEFFLSKYSLKENRDHLKQRQRLAPDRNYSAGLIEKIADIGEEYGISVSLCNWVRSQIFDKEKGFEIIKDSREKGFCCLGYQGRMFGNDS
jgi:DNA repair photolyase